MTLSQNDAIRELQREYLAEIPARLEELRADVARFRAGDPGATSSLKTRFHQLAGSGGSYGFPEISRIARELEQWIASGPGVTEANRLDDGLQRLVGAFRQAGADVAAPVAAAPSPAGTPSALVIVTATSLRQTVVRSLEAAGFQVQVGARHDQPSAAASERQLDLLVIAGEAGEGDPSAVASSWTANAAHRPRAVVLIETLRAVDRLRAVAAGIDAVIPVEAIDPALTHYATTLVRIGAPPSGVLLIEPDVQRAETITGVLESANMRVVRCPHAHAVQELLEREIPDLLLIDARPGGVDARAITSLVRQDRRFYLHPILILGAGDPAERIGALQAGADDFLAEPIDPELLVQAVVSRAERGRRLRELVHRDAHTGLLNSATLLAELEHTVAYERRHGGTIAFVIFDLDRFRETNERHGHSVGDQVLLHVANVFRANVRASDIIGRYSGEEFGMVLRGGTPAGAAVLAGKLRRVLGEQPFTTASGEVIPVRVSVGAACFPQDGSTAPELARAADRALQMAKGE